MIPNREKTAQDISRILAIESEQVDTLVREATTRPKGIRVGVVLRQLAQVHIHRGLLAYFANSDAGQMRQELYTATKLITLALDEDGGPMQDAPFDYFFALLSCSREAILELASKARHLDPAVRPNEDIGFYSELTRLLILGEDAAALELASKPKRVKKRDNAIFCRLAVDRDVDGIREYIEKYEIGAPTGGYLVAEWIPEYSATYLLRLVAFRGLDVEVSSDHLDRNLLNMAPLESYSLEYDFLRTGLPQRDSSIIGKLKEFLGW